MMYQSGIRKFRAAAAGYLIQSSNCAELERRALAHMDCTACRMDFETAAGATLAAVNADPRNHFGKHALRRFDK